MNRCGGKLDEKKVIATGLREVKPASPVRTSVQFPSASGAAAFSPFKFLLDTATWMAAAVATASHSRQSPVSLIQTPPLTSVTGR